MYLKTSLSLQSIKHYTKKHDLFQSNNSKEDGKG